MPLAVKTLTLFFCFFLVSFYTGNKPNYVDIRLNQIQIIGSHNSYKQSLDPLLYRLLNRLDSNSAKKIDYSHPSLTEQLNLGLLNLEIDIYADEKGGKYAHPKGLLWAPGQAPYDPKGIMNTPGFKVFHIQDLDFRSNCYTFTSCLQELKIWSEDHPNHMPIFITMNAKDEPINRPPGFTVPEKFTPAVFDSLDKSIWDNLGISHLIIPDQIRGHYPSLEAAVLDHQWPTLKDSKGKFIFILDENGEKRTAYIVGHPSLKGRLLFADAEPGTPEAAIHIMNEAPQDLAKIQALVKKGYIIRTRADADTQEARKNDYSRFEAAKTSGAQIITTDYYQKSTHFISDYSIHFEKGGFYRPNPLF